MKSKKNNQGSLMVGSLFMMLIISATSIAIINRSLHGAVLTGDSKKSYSAYQASDSNAEDFLNNLKNLDKELGTNRIPENTDFDHPDFCPADRKTVCLDGSSSPISSGSKVSDVFRIEGEGDSQGLNRKIQLDVSKRISSGLGNNDFEVERCGDGISPCTYNQCDVKISLTPSGDASIRAKIKGYEVRRSIQVPGGGELNDTTYGWRMVKPDSSPYSFGIIDAEASFILKNGGDAFAVGGQYGKNYFFTVKALNENPLSLDSLYLSNGAGKSNKKVTMPDSATCSGCASNPKYLSGLNCTSTHPDHAEPVTVENACCGGEYYQCKAGYDANSSKNSCVPTL